MPPKLSVYIATSLDGFIARSDGAIDWLPPIEADSSVGDYGYQAFMNSVDVLVIGRRTYESVLGFGGWYYEGKPVIVLSRSLTDVPEQLAGKMELYQGTPAEVIAYLTGRGYQHAYLDGGHTIQAFLRDGFVDELTITRIPVLLGDGLPLFGPVENDVQLEHVRTTAYTNGLVQSIYRRVPTDG